jgi:hypothetical protein
MSETQANIIYGESLSTRPTAVNTNTMKQWVWINGAWHEMRAKYLAPHFKYCGIRHVGVFSLKNVRTL